MNNIFKLCRYEFKIQLCLKKVWMGYFLGIVTILREAQCYFMYAKDTRQPINVLEAFIVSCNNYNTSMFLVLGWMLVISEAPFINDNAYYLLCRTDKRKWNTAILIYIFMQAIIYYSLIALATVIFSFHNGFIGNIWSSPLIKLTSNVNASFAVYFPYRAFINNLSVIKAFGYTWGMVLLYGFIIGLLLYTFNLLSNQIIGALATFIFHFVGYETMKEGMLIVIRYSLLARSMPVLQIGKDIGVKLSDTFLIYFFIILMLIYISDQVIRLTDFKEAAKGEAE